MTVIGAAREIKSSYASAMLDRLSRMAAEKPKIVEKLAIAREEKNEAVIAACEAWLRLYDRLTERLAAHPAHRAPKEPQEISDHEGTP